MRKLFANVLAAAALMAAWCSPSPVMAQSSNDSIPPMEDWYFGDRYVIDNMYFYLDRTNNLAEFYSVYTSYTDSLLVIPSEVVYQDKAYPVVSICGGYYNSSQDNQCKAVVVPESVRIIKNGAFNYFQNLQTIEVLGSSVQSWGSNVFGSKSYRQPLTLRMHASEPPVCEGSFNSYGNNIKVIVPNGSIHAYRVANWVERATLVEETPISVTVDLDTPGALSALVLEQAAHLSEINVLKVSGTLNADDWSAIKLMNNLCSIDLSEVTNVTIPSSEFMNSGIENIVLPRGLVMIEGAAFAGTRITNLDLPENLQEIGSSAFRGSSVLHVQFPASLLSIGTEAFEYCNLKEIHLPASLITLDSYAFAYNSALESVEFSDGITSIPSSCFYGCVSLKEFTSPATLTSIGSYAFYGCTALESLSLNEGLSELGSGTFDGCASLSEIVLPSSLRSVCYSFQNCRNVKSVVCRSLLPPTSRGGYNILGYVDLNDVVLSVPKWGLADYMQAPGWSNFVTIETNDYKPMNILVDKDYIFAVDQAVEADYRPNISLCWTENSDYDEHGNYSYKQGNLTISNRGKLAVNSLDMYFSPYAKVNTDYSYYYGYALGKSDPASPTCLIVNGEMRAEDVTIHLMNYRDRWQFISFPFDVKMSDIVPDDEATQWVIREYDGKARAEARMDETWLNLSADDVLKAGRGYIMHCYNTNGNYRIDFTVKPDKTSVTRQDIFVSTDKEVSLEENLSEFAHNRSWNLIGNPYPSYYDSRFMNFGGVITVWNSNNKVYRAYSTLDDNYILSPGEAFFVQRPVDQETIVFDKDGRQKDLYSRELSANAPTRAHAAVRQLYNIELTSNGLSDRTRVVFNEYASAGYELDKDASKFMAMDKALPQIYTISGNARYAINERPEADGKVALGIHCGEAGEYTIALSKDVEGEVVLEDVLSGACQVITADKGYTFSAAAGDINDRFFLNIAPVATGIESIAKEGASGNSFNLMGQPVDAAARGIIVRDGQKVVK